MTPDKRFIPYRPAHDANLTGLNLKEMLSSEPLVVAGGCPFFLKKANGYSELAP